MTDIFDDFINGLIDLHFPENRAPKYVNYPMFREEKFKQLKEYLLINVSHGDFEYVDNNLIFEYESDLFLDVGDFDHITEAVMRAATIVIPDELIEKYEDMMS